MTPLPCFVVFSLPSVVSSLPTVSQGIPRCLGAARANLGLGISCLQKSGVGNIWIKYVAAGTHILMTGFYVSTVGSLCIRLFHFGHHVRRHIRADQSFEGVVDVHGRGLWHRCDHASKGRVDFGEVRKAIMEGFC